MNIGIASHHHHRRQSEAEMNTFEAGGLLQALDLSLGWEKLQNNPHFS